MIVWALWHGGHSYASPDMSHLETFESQTAAVEACRDRYDNVDGRTPAVDESSGMTVWLADPSDSDDPYPDRLIVRSDRGRWMVIGC